MVYSINFSVESDGSGLVRLVVLKRHAGDPVSEVTPYQRLSLNEAMDMVEATISSTWPEVQRTIW